MFKSKTKKKLKSISILILILGTLIISLDFNYFNINSDETSNKVETIERYDNLDDNLNTADYSSSLDGTGGNLDVTLHQSLINSTEIEFSNLDSSNSFIESCPTDTNFNSSFINATIEAIKAPNKHIIVEDDNDGNPSFHNFDSLELFMSFEAKGIGYIENISMRIREDQDVHNTYIRLRFFDSEFLGGRIRPRNQISIIVPKSAVNGTSIYWWNETGIHQFYNSSETYNNTYFLYAEVHTDSTFGAIIWSNGAYDEFGTDAVDESIVLTPSEDIYLKDTTNPIDIPLRIGVAPLNNTPNPVDIGLKINNTAVSKYLNVNGSGYWSSTQPFGDPSGILSFEVTADWWDVSCNITNVLINYTKTDLQSASTFNIPGSGQLIDWNSTLGSLNNFDPTFSDYRISFNVPGAWSNLKAFNGSAGEVVVDTSAPIVNNYQDITIYGASNGPNWYITGQSNNLLQSIDMYKGLNPITEANYSDTVSFEAEFSEDIVPGPNGVNLSVYSPILINNKLNYTTENTTVTGDSEIEFDDWIISNTVTDYGIFRVQIFWNNETAAGFRDDLLTIYGETELSHISPPDNGYYDPSSSEFDIIVYINDTGQNIPIDGTIDYRFNGGSWSSTSDNNGTSGYYNVTVDPTSYNYGPNTVEIKTSLQYYNNDSIQFIFNFVNRTSIEDITKSFTSLNGVNVTYTFNYTDTDFGNELIIGAGFSNISPEHPNLDYFNKGFGNGTYSVEIAINNVPARINPYEFNFTLSKLGKEAQKITLLIKVILLNTTIEIISSIPTIKRISGLNQTIELYFNSTYDGSPISDITTDDVKVYDEGGSLWERGPGDHNWTLIDLPTEDYYILNVSTYGLDSGEYIITLNISNYPIYNFSTRPLTFTLLGNDSISNLVSVELDGTPLTPTGSYNYYNASLGSDIDVEFNITDLDYGNNLVLDSGSAAIITVTYLKTTGTPSSGNLTFNRYAATFYRGNIDTTALTEEGNYTITISIELINYEVQSFSFNLTITPRPTVPPGFAFEDLLPYLIMIGAVAALAAGSVAIYRGVVVPKKREKKRILSEVRTIFDDAINLEHILVLYKGTGTCVYFKSFGSEAIDPELISGFISAVSSFGKEMVAQKALNEITYGDKMLLLADGEFTRVALVLSKKASIILRKHLTEFIAIFEKTYEKELPNWRGQLNIFRNAGQIVDEILSTSIILPHKITYDFSDVKALKNPHSKEILKIAHSCCEEAERDFFFIATLLKESSERTKKDTAEIFSGVKELRDKKILMPIEISTIEIQPISQQEMNLISQKVAGLVSLSPEEKQKLVNDLAQMGPAEREAYFVSIAERQEIVSAPIEVKAGIVKIENLKSAKKEIKNLKKNALLAKKEKEYDKTITIYQNAAMIATNWEIPKNFEELQDLIRRTKIDDFKVKLKKLESEAKIAAKQENFPEAAQKFKMASRIASEIFKLGVTEMTKEVKRLSNKSKEYEKLV